MSTRGMMLTFPYLKPSRKASIGASDTSGASDFFFQPAYRHVA